MWTPSLPDMALLEHLSSELAVALGEQHSNALLRITEAGQFAYTVLDQHPLEALRSFTAPADWFAIGVHSNRARAHAFPPGGDQDVHNDSTRAILTMLFDRTGASRAVARRGATIDRVPGPVQGLLADACRRALGLGPS